LPILAAALTAQPMFLFITASVNNDEFGDRANNLIIWQMIVLFKISLSISTVFLIAVLVLRLR